MTDWSPDPELDELVTAYLDGEAMAAERARVQGDPSLLARAEQLRAVSRMIAEPVEVPDAALRDAHIVAALEASSTSPVVTALPARRNRPDLLRFASVAAAVLAILVAVPLLLSNTGDDDENMAATEVNSADDDLPTMDSMATAEMAADEEPEGRSAADEAAADDGAVEAFGEPEMAAAGTADDPGGFDAVLAGVARIDVTEAPSPQALRRAVESRLGSDSDASAAGEGREEAPSTGLACGPAIASEISQRGPARAFGSTIVDGVASEYVVFSSPDAIIVLFDATTCAVSFAG